MNKYITIRLKDYLGPGGRYPYTNLAKDLEIALDRAEPDQIVSLISVPGFTMLSGMNTDAFGEYKWFEYSTGQFINYKSAEDALKGKNGKIFED